jgi:AcrR family transcriptional regulator
MAGLREQNKAIRREAILDAALELLREHETRELTTEQIASIAGVSHATVFNLVGTREQLLHALLDRVRVDVQASLARLDASGGGDPIKAARLIVAQSAIAFSAEPVAFRRVVRAVGAGDAHGSSVFDPAQLQVAAMREAQKQGIIDPAFDAEGLGRQIFVSYFGALLQWSAGRLDDRALMVAVQHGLVSVLAAAATEEHRDRFVAELRALTKRLGRLSRQH